VYEWLDSEKLTTHDLGAICRALGPVSGSTHKKRSLLSNLGARRRRFVLALDVAQWNNRFKFLEVLPHPRMCGQYVLHTVFTSRKWEKAKWSMIYSTRKCANKKGPGCDRVLDDADVSTSFDEEVHTQVHVLKYMEERLSTHQLQKVLDIRC